MSTQDQDMQDRDTVQEQIQERMELENEINLCKFYKLIEIELE